MTDRKPIHGDTMRLSALGKFSTRLILLTVLHGQQLELHASAVAACYAVPLGAAEVNPEFLGDLPKAKLVPYLKEATPLRPDSPDPV